MSGPEDEEALDREIERLLALKQERQRKQKEAAVAEEKRQREAEEARKREQEEKEREEHRRRQAQMGYNAGDLDKWWRDKFIAHTQQEVDADEFSFWLPEEILPRKTPHASEAPLPQPSSEGTPLLPTLA